MITDTYTCTSTDQTPVTLADVLAFQELTLRLAEIQANSPLAKIKRMKKPVLYVGANVSGELCDSIVEKMKSEGVNLWWERSPIFDPNQVAFIDLDYFKWPFPALGNK